MAQKIVVLDPGHGGRDPGAVARDPGAVGRDPGAVARDPGAVGHGRQEKDDALWLALSVQELLEKQGIIVHMTRQDDRYVELHSRPRFALKKEADVLVSIHRNSFGQATAHGTELWIHPSATTSQALGAALLERLAKTGIQANRGIKKGNYVVLGTEIPSVMLELGFITNEIDNRLFDDCFMAYAEDIARGICEFLQVPYHKEPVKQYVRIQLGAYTYPENEAGARKDLERIRAMGLEAFLVIPSEEQVEQA